MTERILVHEPGDVIYTIAVSGEIHAFRVEPDGALTEVHPAELAVGTSES